MISFNLTPSSAGINIDVVFLMPLPEDETMADE